jgi:hypothetical protein
MKNELQSYISTLQQKRNRISEQISNGKLENIQEYNLLCDIIANLKLIVK